MRSWSVDDPDGQLSKLLDACVADGPQVVNRGGTETAVLMSVAEWQLMQRSGKFTPDTPAPAKPTLTVKEWLLADTPRWDMPDPPRGGWLFGKREACPDDSSD